mmetsp:Transcript_9629/g.35279  ORF Transcript_9629/g.35279 Transcript_9629/m.35279 type:complete len:1778 (-) Transcript_9629:28-5361(-)
MPRESSRASSRLRSKELPAPSAPAEATPSSKPPAARAVRASRTPNRGTPAAAATPPSAKLAVSDRPHSGRVSKGASGAKKSGAKAKGASTPVGSTAKSSGGRKSASKPPRHKLSLVEETGVDARYNDDQGTKVDAGCGADADTLPRRRLTNFRFYDENGLVSLASLVGASRKTRGDVKGEGSLLPPSSAPGLKEMHVAIRSVLDVAIEYGPTPCVWLLTGLAWYQLGSPAEVYSRHHSLVERRMLFCNRLLEAWTLDHENFCWSSTLGKALGRAPLADRQNLPQKLEGEEKVGTDLNEPTGPKFEVQDLVADLDFIRQQLQAYFRGCPTAMASKFWASEFWQSLCQRGVYNDILSGGWTAADIKRILKKSEKQIAKRLKLNTSGYAYDLFTGNLLDDIEMDDVFDDATELGLDDSEVNAVCLAAPAMPKPRPFAWKAPESLCTDEQFGKLLAIWDFFHGYRKILATAPFTLGDLEAALRSTWNLFPETGLKKSSSGSKMSEAATGVPPVQDTTMKPQASHLSAAPATSGFVPQQTSGSLASPGEEASDGAKMHQNGTSPATATDTAPSTSAEAEPKPAVPLAVASGPPQSSSMLTVPLPLSAEGPTMAVEEGKKPAHPDCQYDACHFLSSLHLSLLRILQSHTLSEVQTKIAREEKWKVLSDEELDAGLAWQEDARIYLGGQQIDASTGAASQEAVANGEMAGDEPLEEPPGSEDRLDEPKASEFIDEAHQEMVKVLGYADYGTLGIDIRLNILLALIENSLDCVPFREHLHERLQAEANARKRGAYDPGAVVEFLAKQEKMAASVENMTRAKEAEIQDIDKDPREVEMWHERIWGPSVRFFDAERANPQNARELGEDNLGRRYWTFTDKGMHEGTVYVEGYDGSTWEVYKEDQLQDLVEWARTTGQCSHKRSTLARRTMDLASYLEDELERRKKRGRAVPTEQEAAAWRARGVQAQGNLLQHVRNMIMKLISDAPFWLMPPEWLNRRVELGAAAAKCDSVQALAKLLVQIEHEASTSLDSRKRWTKTTTARWIEQTSASRTLSQIFHRVTELQYELCEGRGDLGKYRRLPYDYWMRLVRQAGGVFFPRQGEKIAFLKTGFLQHMEQNAPWMIQSTVIEDPSVPEGAELPVIESPWASLINNIPFAAECTVQQIVMLRLENPPRSNPGGVYVGPVCWVVFEYIPRKESASTEVDDEPRTLYFTAVVHPKSELPDFMLAPHVYKRAMDRKWDAGQPFRMFFEAATGDNSRPGSKGGTYWKGSIVRNRLKSPKEGENAEDPWECVEVTWDNQDQLEAEAETMLSPWELEDVPKEVPTVLSAVPRLGGLIMPSVPILADRARLNFPGNPVSAFPSRALASGITIPGAPILPLPIAAKLKSTQPTAVSTSASKLSETAGPDVREEDGDKKKKKGKEPKPPKEAPCQICEKPDGTVTCHCCLKSYHPTCLGPQHKLPGEGGQVGCLPGTVQGVSAFWECPDCIKGRPPCALCGVRAEKPAKGRPECFKKCSLGICGRFFHTECIQKHALAKRHAVGKGFYCPQHYCHICKRSGDGMQMTKCIRCLTAYHDGCMPEGARRVGDKMMICALHEDDSKPPPPFGDVAPLPPIPMYLRPKGFENMENPVGLEQRHLDKIASLPPEVLNPPPKKKDKDAQTNGCGPVGSEPPLSLGPARPTALGTQGQNSGAGVPFTLAPVAAKPLVMGLATMVPARPVAASVVTAATPPTFNGKVTEPASQTATSATGVSTGGPAATTEAGTKTAEASPSTTAGTVVSLAAPESAQ